jgi:hypothetical protein
MLNPDLFRRLQRAYGEGNVTVFHENSELQGYYKKDPLRDRREKPKLYVDKPGEEYKLNCPFCSDTRHRFFVNHRWGVRDPKTGTINLWLLNCFNEQCNDVYDNQLHLFKMLYDNATPPDKLQKEVVARRGPRKVDWPGPMWRLDDLAKRSPKHPAIQYLESRLYDPIYLGKKYQVAYCLESKMELAHRRVVAPIFQNGKFLSWQARALQDDLPKGTPKWFTLPGSRTSEFFYNFDNAIKGRTIVLVEGPSDAWNFGPQAMSLIGKTLSPEKISLLKKYARKGVKIVVMLDPNQDAKSIEKGRKHHIEVVYKQLNEEPTFKGRVAKCYLPSGYDPGDLDREYLRDYAKFTAATQGVKLDFRKVA